MPGAGYYRHRVEFLANSPTTDSSRSGTVDNWRPFCIRQGRRPLEKKAAENVVPDANRSVIETLKMCFRSDSKTRQLSSSHRATINGKTYEIETAVDPDGLQKEVEIVFKSREVAR